MLDVAAYLLHAQSWRETSLLLQAFTREHGVVTMVAKGAKRPYSTLRAVLLALQPLNLSWSGMGEIRTLIGAESCGIIPLSGQAFMSAWYMNELLLRLLAREDPHPVLFDAYEAALYQLAGAPRDEPALSAPASLRRFEWVLLRETGYGLEGDAPDFGDGAGEPILRQRLHERLERLLDRPLLTRRVMRDMQRR